MTNKFFQTKSIKLPNSFFTFFLSRVSAPIARPVRRVGGPTVTPMQPGTVTSRDGKYQLQILAQPEQQHRARYQTEGSRGAVKDRSGNGFPIVKLIGYKKPAVLEVRESYKNYIKKESEFNDKLCLIEFCRFSSEPILVALRRTCFTRPARCRARTQRIASKRNWRAPS